MKFHAVGGTRIHPIYAFIFAVDQHLPRGDTSTLKDVGLKCLSETRWCHLLEGPGTHKFILSIPVDGRNPANQLISRISRIS